MNIYCTGYSSVRIFGYPASRISGKISIRYNPIPFPPKFVSKSPVSTIPDHVDPKEPVEGLQRHPRQLRVFVLQVLKTHCEEVVPVVQEESLLAHAQQAGHQREQGQTVLVPRAHIQGLAVQHLHKVLEAGHIDLVLNGGRHRHQDLDKESRHGVLNVFVLHLEEVGSTLLHELKGNLKLFDRNHLHPEELHPHEERYDGLNGLGCGLFAPQLSELKRKPLPY